MKSKIDLTGQRFGRLTVVRPAPTRTRPCGGTANYWFCECRCGGQAEAWIGTLRSGRVKSCGCLQKERVSQANKTHGMSRSPEYRIWRLMRSRCSVPSLEAYKYYGGRGIMVCDRWQKFENFYVDMGSRPSKKHTIDRIDNDGNYEPNNCRWATRKTQMRNTRSTRFVTVFGEKMPLVEAVERHDANYHSVKSKINRGQLLEEVLDLVAFEN